MAHKNGIFSPIIERRQIIIMIYIPLNKLFNIIPSQILEQESRIHVLINNASVMWRPLERTPEGFESHFGINHLTNFVMTQLLMPLMHR